MYVYKSIEMCSSGAAMVCMLYDSYAITAVFNKCAIV